MRADRRGCACCNFSPENATVPRSRLGCRVRLSLMTVPIRTFFEKGLSLPLMPLPLRSCTAFPPFARYLLLLLPLSTTAVHFYQRRLLPCCAMSLKPNRRQDWRRNAGNKWSTIAGVSILLSIAVNICRRCLPTRYAIFLMPCRRQDWRRNAGTN